MTPDISSLIPRFGRLFEKTLVTWSKNFEPTSHGEPRDGQTTRFSVEAGATESTSNTALLQDVVASEGGVDSFCHPPEDNSCSGGRKATLIMGPECSKHIGVSVQVALDIRNFAGWDGTMLGQVSILQDQHQPRGYRQLVCRVWGTLSIIVYYHVLSCIVNSRCLSKMDLFGVRARRPCFYFVRSLVHLTVAERNSWRKCREIEVNMPTSSVASYWCARV